MERKLLEAMSREEPLSLPAADSSPTEGSLWQAGQANLDEEGLMGRQMPGSATEDGESLAGVLDSEPAIGEKEISEAMAVLEKYKSAKASLDKRIIDNEEWYKLGHWKQYGNRVMEGKRAPSTGWLFNSIANKHADAMDNYPEPNVLPRAQDDEETAKLLSDILPVVLEQADYESVYSDTWWRKLKQGTGVKGIFWDPALREGLGDIAIRSMDLLMLYWEPGVEDIQDSANFFSLALADNDRLTARWPQLEGKAGSSGITVGQYVSDRNIDTSEKSVVVDWYYKREKPGGQTVVHYCKFCNGVVLYASENDPAMAETGFYDHGKYPFVFDPLFVEENSPAGFGYIDVMKDTQDAIDRMTQAMDENTLAAAKKRYLISDTAGVNEDELLDTAKDVVHITGRLDERGLYGAGYRPAALQHHRLPTEPCGRAEGDQRQPGREPGRRDQRPDGGLGHCGAAGGRLEAQPGHAEELLPLLCKRMLLHHRPDAAVLRREPRLPDHRPAGRHGVPGVLGTDAAAAAGGERGRRGAGRP